MIEVILLIVFWIGVCCLLSWFKQREIKKEYAEKIKEWDRETKEMIKLEMREK
jgi:hypothetical protein